VYKDFFVAGLRMPPHPALADILLHFQTQLHQLTPNAIAQLSKIFWAIGSFGGVPSGNLFVNPYELHYQPKTVETPEGDRITQYRCLNFHAKRDDIPKLSLTIKNKWSTGWNKLWFYCRMPCRRSSGCGKSVYDLCLRMSELDYAVEPEVECSYDDPNDVAFFRAAATIGCHDVVEEYETCKMYPLAMGFGFESVSLGMTHLSKVETPLLLFVVGPVATEHANRILVEVEMDAERVLGASGQKNTMPLE
jgi:hypothetical protein